MERLEQIKQPISNEFEVFKQKFDESLQSSNPLLGEVINFIKQRKGKMMRPMLVLLVAKSIGNVNEKTYSAAAAAATPALMRQRQDFRPWPRQSRRDRQSRHRHSAGRRR